MNSISREEILEDVNTRLTNVGIDPEWKGLSNKTYKQKKDYTLSQRSLDEKVGY